MLADTSDVRRPGECLSGGRASGLHPQVGDEASHGSLQSRQRNVDVAIRPSDSCERLAGRTAGDLPTALMAVERFGHILWLSSHPRFIWRTSLRSILPAQ
jgi:hypothetical protein